MSENEFDPPTSPEAGSAERRGGEQARDPEITPAQEAAVRRALAAAGGPEPMPEEIAGRLDQMIAELAVERGAGGDADTGAEADAGAVSEPATDSASDTTSDDRPDETFAAPPSHPVTGSIDGPSAQSRVVVPLDAASRRRRTRVRVLLGAAAAVVAVTVGAGVVNQGNDDVSSADQMAKDNPARSRGASDATAAESGDESAGKSDGDSAAEPPAQESASRAPTLGAAPGAQALKRIVTDEPLRAIRPDALRADLVSLQQVTLPAAATADYEGAVLTAPSDFRCEPAAFGAGYLVGVTYEDKPAVVAFREPVGVTQVAEVLACGTGDVLRSTSIAAPR